MESKRPRAAVLRIPGVNCELETMRACDAAGFEAHLVRWNETEVDGYDAYVLPGGFSYQDRIRAGVVASHERVIRAVGDAADRGRPVLGICNGAQVLVEAGLVPGLNRGQVEVALAPNRDGGYRCQWVHLAACPQSTSPFVRGLSAQGPIPMPVAHAEGRFVSAEPGLLNALDYAGQIAFRYVRPAGAAADGALPFNPNGAMLDAAGLVNAQGNVLALMPHPERAAWLFQVPSGIGGRWGRARREALGAGSRLDEAGPGLAVFRGLAAAAREVAA